MSTTININDTQIEIKSLNSVEICFECTGQRKDPITVLVSGTSLPSNVLDVIRLTSALTSYLNTGYFDLEG